MPGGDKSKLKELEEKLRLFIAKVSPSDDSGENPVDEKITPEVINGWLETTRARIKEQKKLTEEGEALFLEVKAAAP